MKSVDARVPRSYFLFQQDPWFSGIDKSMESLGSAQEVRTDDLIRLQNKAIRNCWAVTGNHLRQAMFTLSGKTNVYPEELKEDLACRKMLTQMKVKV